MPPCMEENLCDLSASLPFVCGETEAQRTSGWVHSTLTTSSHHSHCQLPHQPGAMAEDSEGDRTGWREAGN